MAKHILLTNIYVKSIKHTSSPYYIHKHVTSGRGALFDPYFLGPCWKLQWKSENTQWNWNGLGFWGFKEVAYIGFFFLKNYVACYMNYISILLTFILINICNNYSTSDSQIICLFWKSVIIITLGISRSRIQPHKKKHKYMYIQISHTDFK